LAVRPENPEIGLISRWSRDLISSDHPMVCDKIAQIENKSFLRRF
jgi:hypothetical protein